MANQDRWPRLRMDGPGYETEGREAFDNMVEFTFDYSDLDVKRSTINRQLKELENVLTSIGGKTANVRNIGKLSQGFQILPDSETVAKDMADLGRIVAAESKAAIKKHIGGRIETGRMIGSVYGRTKKSAGMVTVTAGWLDLWYKYFGFQENGTTKVKPMRAILKTFLEVSPQVVKSLQYYTNRYANGKAGK